MGLVTVVVLGKFFTPGQFGHFMLAQNALLLLVMVGGLWLNSSLLRLIPQYRRTHELSSLLGTAFIWGLATVAVVMGLSILGLLVLRTRLDSGLYGLLWLAVLGTPFLLMFGLIQVGYRASGQAGRFSVLTLVRVIGGFVLGFLLAVILGWGPAGMLSGLIAVAALAVLWHALRAPRWIRDLLRRPPASRSTLIEMVSFSAPIVGVNVAAIILSVSDRFVIAGYLDARAVGLYSAGYAIAEGGMRLISNVIQLAVNPVAYDSWETYGQIPTFEFIERLFRFYALIAIPAVVGLSLLSKPIVVTFTTSEFSEGSKIIPFVAVALLFHGYALLMNIVFDSTKRTVIPFLNFAGVGLFNVAANIVLVPRYGFEAAAWTTTASYVLLFGLTILTVRTIYPLRFWGSYLWKALVASAGMAAVILALRPGAGASHEQLFLTIGAAVLCYPALLVLVRGIAWSELRALRQSISFGMARGE
jgi:O-antigen/teichoic acid export membrane protein